MRFFAPLMLFCLPACGALGPQPETLDGFTLDVAERLNEADFNLGPGLEGVTKQATAQGAKLTLRIENVPTGRVVFDDNAARKMLREKVCETRNFERFVEIGGTLWVEMVSDFGTELTSFGIVRC